MEYYTPVKRNKIKLDVLTRKEFQDKITGKFKNRTTCISFFIHGKNIHYICENFLEGHLKNR